MASSKIRFPAVDLLRAIASQLIVLHHLAFYGPMSDHVMSLSSGLIVWLSDYARIAVQVFLVLGGFFAARSLAPDGKLAVDKPVLVLLKRYLRLVLPFTCALLVAMLGAAVARGWMAHDSIPAAPAAGQFFAHIALLQGVLDVDSLSAGVWYVAIDFQLFAMLLGVLWVASRLGWSSGRWLVLLLAVASLFYFNLDSEWDEYAIYFFGAYALGALAWWASSPHESRIGFVLLAVLTVGSLILDFRSRIVVALLTASVLVASQHLRRVPPWVVNPLVRFLSRISYSVFLTHFPVCLLVNAGFSAFMPGSPWVQALGMLVAWGSSVAFGALFYRYVENPSQGWAARLSAHFHSSKTVPLPRHYG